MAKIYASEGRIANRNGENYAMAPRTLCLAER
jgi:hypothetical protein